MPVGKLNKRLFWFTRIWCTLWLVNFGRFCQHSSIMAVERPYNEWRGVRTCDKQNVKENIFLMRNAFTKNRRIAQKMRSMPKVSLQSFPPMFWKEFNLSALSMSNFSDECERCTVYSTILVVCLVLMAITNGIEWPTWLLQFMTYVHLPFCF